VVKLPRTPPVTLSIDDSDLTGWTYPSMARIHGVVGAYALPWHQLRHFGPTATRFDPHPYPAQHHADYAVLYAAADVDTALAEVFQHGRVVQPAAPNRPTLTVWRPTRTLRLLDIRGQWPIRQGASHVLNTGPHAACRQWAHAIADHPQHVDGILYTSSMTGQDAAALFLPAEDSFPAAPELSLPLDHPGLIGPVVAAAKRIRYALG